MPDDNLKPAEPSDIAESIAFALYSGRKHVHDSETFTARIAADRIVRHLERCGFVVLKKPPSVGRGFGEIEIQRAKTIALALLLALIGTSAQAASRES